MSGIGGVSSGSAVAELMKLLQSNQEQAVDLAKKLIKVAHEGNLAQSVEPGKGESIDILA